MNNVQKALIVLSIFLWGCEGVVNVEGSRIDDASRDFTKAKVDLDQMIPTQDAKPLEVFRCSVDEMNCVENKNGKVFCNEGICDFPPPMDTTDCNSQEECRNNQNEKTECKEGQCSKPFVNTQQCSDATQCESNLNLKTICVDQECHVPFIAVETCTAEGQECSGNTNGLIRCVAEVCQRGDNPNVRVMWQQDPAHDAIISVTGENVEVFIDTKKRRSVLSAYAQKLTPFLVEKYHASTLSLANIKLENLIPSTTYYFSVKSDAGISREFYFTSAPADDRNFKIIFGGDSRSRPVTRRLVNAMIREKIEADQEIIAFVHGGDFCAQQDNWGQWQSWLDDYEITVTEDGRILPIIVTRGNHEGGILFNQVFANPGSAPDNNYYSTPIGKLLWITLDTDDSMMGDQRVFLEAELQRGQGFRWIVPSYHRPAYPAVKSPSGALAAWVPLFEQYNVDIVGESDGHTLKRTLKIRDGAPAADGIIYFGEGGLGVSQRVPKTARWYFSPPGMAISAHHIQILSFSPTALEYEAHSLAGGIEDGFEVQPRTR